MRSVLVVEDEQRVAASVVRAVSRHVPAVRAASVQEALAMAREPGRRWLAAIVDIGLPDGSGLDLAGRLRAQIPGLPVLVVTGREERHLANDAQATGAHFAFKPISVGEIDAFIGRALAALPARRMARVVEELVKQAALSVRERDIVRLSVEGHSHAVLCERFDVKDSTLKTQIRGVLNKTGEPDLDALVRRLLEAALAR